MALKKSELYSSFWKSCDALRGGMDAKRVIATHPECLPKLSRELFSDDHIASAIAECATLFPA